MRNAECKMQNAEIRIETRNSKLKTRKKSSFCMLNTGFLILENSQELKGNV